MSRDDGFTHADIDVGYLRDPKVKAFIRQARAEGWDDGALAKAILTHLAVLLESWARGEQVALIDAAPEWITQPPDMARLLTDAGLLDGAGRIPDHAWDHWFGEAWGRRGGASDHGRKAAQARWTAHRMPEHPPRHARAPGSDAQSIGLDASQPGIHPVIHSDTGPAPAAAPEGASGASGNGHQ